MGKRNLKKLILPNEKINFFVITVMIFGIISGSIFLMMLSRGDRNSVILQIQNFFSNVHLGKVDCGLAFRNSLIINYLFVFIIWILGLSIVGVIINVFLTYLRGFLVGFSVCSIFLSYGVKGVVASLLYVFTSHIFNMLVVIVLSIYSIMFSCNLFKIIISKKGNNRLMLKRYFIILMFCIIVSFLSSVLEVYLFPNILKIFIKLYV